MKVKTSNPSPRSVGAPQRGRPREFDLASVAQAAARTFWERGYHATSLDDLCDATGLLRGSLYGAFGDKHGILLAALEHYADGALTQLAERLDAARPADEAVREALLHHTRAAATMAHLRGCLVTNTALEMAPRDEEVAARIEAIMRRVTTLFAAAIIRGQAQGVFDPALDERAAADFLLCVTQGMRVLSKVMPDEKRLATAIGIAMQALG
ncbi:MAG TPA: TetR/AcrR family transcriptional regulator [Trinickia sp.]|jgi:TetR/AcrR family transcriptional repressor of nem operon|nr:TetR/AcrR family transcriptional regulator [Trinickia sp.]